MKKYWSGDVKTSSNAQKLEEGVFTWKDPRRIARSLKSSVGMRLHGKSRTPYQAAMSMLNFYINRAGKGLTSRQKSVLNKAKVELKKLFGRI